MKVSHLTDEDVGGNVELEVLIGFTVPGLEGTVYKTIPFQGPQNSEVRSLHVRRYDEKKSNKATIIATAERVRTLELTPKIGETK